MEPPLLQPGVAPVLDRLDDGRVRGGAADPLLLELLDQRALGEPGRGLGEVLGREQLLQVKALPFRQRGKDALLPLFVFRLAGVAFLPFAGFLLPAVAVDPFLVHVEVPHEPRHRARCPEQVPAGRDRSIPLLPGLAENVGRRLLELGRGHLGSHEAVPHQLVEPVLVPGENRFQLSGRMLHRGRADRFVGVLGRFPVPEHVGRRGQPGLPVGRADMFPHRGQRLVGDAHGVGPHVRDEAYEAGPRDVDPLVERLRHHHRLVGGHPELPGGLLLEL